MSFVMPGETCLPSQATLYGYGLGLIIFWAEHFWRVLSSLGRYAITDSIKHNCRNHREARILVN